MPDISIIKNEKNNQVKRCLICGKILVKLKTTSLKRWQNINHCSSSHAQIKNIIGEKYGKLTVVRFDSGNPVKWLCKCECGNNTIVRASNLTSGNTSSCGCASNDNSPYVKGDKHPNWKGGRQKLTRGYIGLVIDGKPVKEHIYVMEKYLGRKLDKYECVHHLNHKRDDNRIENLELMLFSEHGRLHNLNNFKHKFYKDDLIKLVKNSKSLECLAKELNISSSTIRRRLKYFGVYNEYKEGKL